MLYFTPLQNQQNMFLYVPKGVRIKQSPLKDFVFQRTLFGSSGTNIYCWLRLSVTFHYFPKNREALFTQPALQPFPPFLIPFPPLFIFTTIPYYTHTTPSASPHFRSPLLFIRKGSSVPYVSDKSWHLRV